MPADDVPIRNYIKLALPAAKGPIGKYGYCADRERPIRLALSNNESSYPSSETVRLVKNTIKDGDPHYFILKAGRLKPMSTGGDAAKPKPKPALEEQE